MLLPPSLFLVLSGVIASPEVSVATEHAVTVHAGECARHHTPVSVLFHDITPVDGSIWTATHDGGTCAAQASPEGSGVRVSWILDHLDAGETRRVMLNRAPHGGPAALETFAWQPGQDDPGTTSVDLVLGSRPVLRYVHTSFDAERLELTKKPFHHVFAPDGATTLTKGPGGQFPHHRGIFFAYNRCEVGGTSYDVWHAKNGEHQTHVRFLDQQVGPVFGSHTAEIHWCDREGKPFALEHRTLRAWRQPDGGALIDFHTELKATGSPIKLHGDRQHAGVQWRSSQWVADHPEGSTYLRPAAWASIAPDAEANDAAHVDLPWNALKTSIHGSPYTIAYLSAPSNPDGARFSERRYGRFGEYIPAQLTNDEPLELTYRWWIRANHEPSRATIDARHADFAQPPRVVLDG